MTIAVPGSFATIQDAITNATDGDVIQIAPGTYHEVLSLNSATPPLTLRGDPADPSAVVIDGGGHTGDAVITMVDTSSGIVIEGLTITGGQGGDVVGGGLFIAGAASIVRDCVISGNSSGIAGGVYVLGGSALFQRVVFENNTSRAWGGGAMVNGGSTATFEDCAFRQNQSGTVDIGAGGGGGLIVNDSSPTFVRCVFSHNQAANAGGGVIVFGHYDHDVSHPTFRSCEISENVAIPGPPEAGAPEGGGIHIEDNVHALLDRCVVSGNTAWRGGGVNVYRATYEIRDTIVEDNVADVGTLGAGTGGGLYSASVNTNPTLRGPAEVAITGSVFRRNTARIGGGMYVQGDFLTDPQGHKGQLTVVDSVIADNDAAEMGGGIFLAEADATLTRTMLLNNHVTTGAGPGGGIVSSASSSLTLIDSLLAENEATGQGGGAYVDQGGSLAVTGTRFYRNRAAAGATGGALMIGQSASPVSGDETHPVTGSVQNSLFAASDAAHEIYESDCDAQMKSTVVYQNNTFDAGGGDYYGSCSLGAASATAFNARAGKASGNQDSAADFAAVVAAPATIDAGGTAVLAYCSTHAGPYQISPTVGAASAHCDTADVNPTSTTVYSLTPGSSTATVNVGCGTLGVPIAMLPTNGAPHVDPASVTLQWTAATGAASYDVLLDTGDDPSTTVAADITGTSFVVHGLANGTTYRWKVLARSPDCAVPETGPAFSFDTCSAGDCNFVDDFSDGDAGDWQLTGKGGSSSVSDGALVIVATRKPVKVMSPADPVANGTLDMRLAFGAGIRHEAHVLIRVNGKNVGDIAILADREIIRYRGKAGHVKLKSQNDVYFPFDEPFRLRVVMDGDHFQVMKGSAIVLKGSVAGLSAGRFGFKVVRSTLIVDDVRTTHAAD